MRPPEFTGGNNGTYPTLTATHVCFNEAAGIHRRKPGFRSRSCCIPNRFNEAAGIHRRKLVDTACGLLTPSQLQ